MGPAGFDLPEQGDRVYASFERYSFFFYKKIYRVDNEINEVLSIMSVVLVVRPEAERWVY